MAALLAELDMVGADPGAAAESGAITKEKVEGVWLFAQSDEVFRAGVEAVGGSASAFCREWLLAPMPPLVGAVTKELSTRGITRDAVQALLRGSLRRGHLNALALLTQEYQPYFAVFHPVDRPELQRQVAAMSELIATGRVRGSDLPEPQRSRSLRAWRANVLQHGEYLGLGRLVDGALMAWQT